MEISKVLIIESVGELTPLFISSGDLDELQMKRVVQFIWSKAVEQ